MNTSLTKTLFFIGFLLISLACNAQDEEDNTVPDYSDYVITTKGDTIHCNVDRPLIGKPRYQSKTMSKDEKITPDNISEYSYNFFGKLYRAVYRDDHPTKEFLEVVENGPISIYEIVRATPGPGVSIATGASLMLSVTSSARDWFIGKNSDNVHSIKSSLYLMGNHNGRKDEFGEMLKDKPDIYNKYMADDKFTFKQIKNLVHLYNTGKPLK